MNTKTPIQETLFSSFFKKISLFDKDKSINAVKSSTNYEQESVSRAKVALRSTFYKTPPVQAIDNLKQVVEAIKRMAERANKKMAESERGQKLIASADEYGIPYNPNDVDWLRLTSQIKEYQSLLSQAKNYNLRVDTKYYDPGAIKDSIEDYIVGEGQARKDQNSYYSNTRL